MRYPRDPRPLVCRCGKRFIGYVNDPCPACGSLERAPKAGA